MVDGVLTVDDVIDAAVKVSIQDVSHFEVNLCWNYTIQLLLSRWH